MKNVRPEMLKKCILILGDEYKRLVASLTKGKVEVEFCCDGIDYCQPDGVEWNDISYDGEGINAMLSDYFGVNVTSVHMDTCDFPGVWVCYSNSNPNEEVF